MAEADAHHALKPTNVVSRDSRRQLAPVSGRNQQSAGKAVPETENPDVRSTLHTFEMQFRDRSPFYRLEMYLVI
jgi:hypothetical protein